MSFDKTCWPPDILHEWFQLLEQGVPVPGSMFDEKITKSERFVNVVMYVQKEMYDRGRMSLQLELHKLLNVEPKHL